MSRLSLSRRRREQQARLFETSVSRAEPVAAVETRASSVVDVDALQATDGQELEDASRPVTLSQTVVCDVPVETRDCEALKLKVADTNVSQSWEERVLGTGEHSGRDSDLVFVGANHDLGPRGGGCDVFLVGGFEAQHDWQRKRKTQKRSREYQEREANPSGETVAKKYSRKGRSETVDRFRNSSEPFASHHSRCKGASPAIDDTKSSPGVKNPAILEVMGCESNFEPPSPPCSPPESPPLSEDVATKDASVQNGVRASGEYLEQHSSALPATNRKTALVEDSKPIVEAPSVEVGLDGELGQSTAMAHEKDNSGPGGQCSILDDSRYVDTGLVAETELGNAARDCIEAREETYGDLKTTYHIRSFDAVISHVLSRFRYLLRPENIRLASIVTEALSPNAKSLFVRLYHRKSCWHSVASLDAAYDDIDVTRAVAELSKTGLLTSSESVKTGNDLSGRLLVARNVLDDMVLEEMRPLCSVIAGGKRMRSFSRNALLPFMSDVLDVPDATAPLLAGQSQSSYGHRSGQRKAPKRQTTIDGSSPADNLSRAILKSEYVLMPRSARSQLERMYFLFFFEEGHNSPMVVLADTGKVRFPSYECVYSADIFPSRQAFEDFEEARSIDLTTQNCVDNKAWHSAVHYGAIGELELSQYMQRTATRASEPIPHHPCETVQGEIASCSRTNSARFSTQFVACTSSVDGQLCHPFFRRFSPIWKYASAAWRSVKALEALKEYRSAIQRIELLLKSGLLPAKRGKMIDRLTINLVHAGDDEQALSVLRGALLEADAPLDSGTRYALARRGIATHRRLRRPVELVKASETVSTKSRCGKIADQAVVASRPAEFSAAIRSYQRSIPVRLYRAKALPSLRESRPEENSPQMADAAGNVGTKCQFIGLGSENLAVSVEELALEWYKAHSGWTGKHVEGGVLRFMWCLLMWKAVYSSVPDVFQTSFQIAPWDLGTEAFYHSRQSIIDQRLDEIRNMPLSALETFIRSVYADDSYFGVLCVGHGWDTYSVEDLVCIACGTGSRPLSRICELLSKNFAYWSGGLPDLVLWKWDVDGASDRAPRACTKLVEVKSQNDALSERQRAWIGELLDAGVDCEVFKVVERDTKQNSEKLAASELDYVQLSRLDAGDLNPGV